MKSNKQQNVTFLKVIGLSLLLLSIAGFVYTLISHTQPLPILYVPLILGIIFSVKATKKAKELK